MNDQPDILDERLAALRAASASWSPPASVDAAIAAAANRRQRASRRDLPATRHAAWALALAASILGLAIIVRTLPPPFDEGAARPAADPAAILAARQAFTPLVPVAEIRAAHDALVVPARVPRMTLAQFGLPIDPARADDAIDAELLVRRDGSLLAYRFVN